LTGPAGNDGTNGTNGAQGAAGATGAPGVIAATAPILYNNGTQTVSLQANGVTAASVANRVRRVSLSGNSFSPSSTSTFDFGNGLPSANRRVRVTSFGSANNDGYLSIVFTVPSDYVGPAAADITACPGLVTPRLSMRWVTDSVQANGSRKLNADISFVRESEITANGGNKFRYNIRDGVPVISLDAAESADPTNIQIATQVMPENGDNWSTGEGANTVWAAGDVILLTISRSGASDLNSARCGVLSITFDYEADQ